MSAATFTGREFNQDTGRARKAAEAGPVVTTRLRPPIARAEDERLSHPQSSIVDLLAMPDAADIASDPPRLRASLPCPVDLG